VVLGDGTEVRRGNTYEQGEWERRGEVRKWMDVPLQLCFYFGNIIFVCPLLTGYEK
jgi:hypothetical protein